jgi:magnesium-transporting ATPase (P-type)
MVTKTPRTPDEELTTMPATPATERASAPLSWHAVEAEEAVSTLDTDPARGLSHAEAGRRLEEQGPNRLPEARRRGPLPRLLGQFDNPLIVVLIVAGVGTLLLRDYVDAAVIFGVVVINAVIGFIQEGKAEKALDAVRAMLATRATVVREGERHEIDAAEIVPGDVVLLESGDRVPADIRLTRAHNLRVEESALTGESVPTEKSVEPVADDASIGDRTCVTYSGTLVAYGQARGVVVATGEDTEVGQIGAMVGEAPTLSTPLTKRLDQFARQITVFILAIGLAAFLYARFVGDMELVDAFLVVVGLAVAAIPEGLPAIITVVLAIGTRAMASQRAIVRRLPAVETLGSVSVICSDKTGTLTRNEMTVVRVMLPDSELTVTGAGYVPDGGFAGPDGPTDVADDAEVQELATAGLLCNDAVLRHGDEGWSVAGDPTEGALVTLALKAGLDQHDLRNQRPRVDQIPFESENRYMATLHHDHHGRGFVFLKGAPERVLSLCASADHDRWQERIDQAATNGERVLALARADVPPENDRLDIEHLPDSFELLGMVGIMDPPREEAIEAVAECQRAGINVKMITGDHAVTAAAIGRELGLHADVALTGESIEGMDDDELRTAAGDNDVIARASPQHKMRLVGALQADGDYVAMTGDGVNDAPALKSADIGVAMGHRGTDAAREASDLVLTDDNFATIAHAVRQGRVVFDNIKKSLLFMLPTNGGQAGLLLIAIFLGLTMPVSVGQILWVNLVTAVTLALALAFEPAEPEVMDHPPRPPQQPLITRQLGLRIAYVSMLMALIALIAFEWELNRGSSIEMARTTAVNTLVAGEVFYLFSVRHFTRSAFTLETLIGNRVALMVVGILVLLQLAFTYSPPLQEVFDTRPLGWASWGVILGLGLAKFLAIEAEKSLWRRRGVRHL